MLSFDWFSGFGARRQIGIRGAVAILGIRHFTLAPVVHGGDRNAEKDAQDLNRGNGVPLKDGSRRQVGLFSGEQQKWSARRATPESSFGARKLTIRSKKCERPLAGGRARC